MKNLYIKYIQRIKNSKIIRGSAVFLIFRILGMGFGYINIWLISKYFGASALGIYSLILSIIAISLAFTKLGTGIILLRFTAKFVTEKRFDKLKSYYLQVIKIISIPGLIFFLILFFLSDFIAAEIFNKAYISSYLKVAAFGVLPFALTQINAQFLRGFKKIGQFSFLQYLISFFTVTGLLIIIYFTKNRDKGIPVILHVLSFVIMFIISAVFVLSVKKWKKIKITEKIKSKDILKTSIPMLNVSLMLIAMQWADKLILGFYVSDTHIGIYHLMTRIAMLAGLSFLAVDSVFAPNISELWSRKDMLNLKRYIHRSTQLIFLSSILIAIPLIIFAKNIIGFFGQEFQTGIYILYILIIGKIFVAWVGPAGIFLVMTGREKINQKTSFIITVLFLVMSVILVLKYDILGMAISITSVLIIKSLLFIYFIKKYYGFLFFYMPQFVRKYINNKVLQKKIFAKNYKLIKPSFLIIGFQKCGTTALHNYLQQHPKIIAPFIKEIDFFGCNKKYNKGTDFYNDFFRFKTKENIISFEASPHYAVSDNAAERIYKYNPEIKIICLVRDPISRAYSAWNMYKKNLKTNPSFFESWKNNCGNITPNNYIKRPDYLQKAFYELIEEEKNALNTGKKVEGNLLYPGLYAQLLQKYYNLFDENNILIIDNNEFSENTELIMNRITKFIDLPDFNWSKINLEPWFVGKYQSKIDKKSLKLLTDFYKKPNEDFYKLTGNIING